MHWRQEVSMKANWRKQGSVIKQEIDGDKK